ncbi:MAG: HNH endonuclease [Terriglobales bacterium]
MTPKKASPSQAEKSIPLRVRDRVLHRDSWRCQICGSMLNLQVHHQVFRSHGGQDCDDNLITLCAACHGRLHGLMRE